jgi:perosamine synthetase
LQLPLTKTEFAENIYWVYGVVLENSVAINAKQAMIALSKKGVGTRPFFWPMHEQPVFQKMGLFSGEHYPVSERIARRGFYIPSGMAITDEQVQVSASFVKEVINEYI